MKSPAWAAASVGTSAAFGVALAAAALAVLFRAMSPPAFSISAASAIAASGALAVLAWRAPRVAIGAAIGVTFGLLPNEIYGCVNALTAPLATMTGPEGSGDFGVFFVGAVIVFLGCVAALPIAALVSAVGRRAPAGFIAVAAAATLASMLVTAFGLASMRRPEPDDLVDVFDDNAQVEVGEHATVGGTTLSYERTREGLRPLRPGDDIGWGVGPDGQPVQLLPTGEMCILHLSGDTATTEVALNPTIDAQCPQLGVYHDKRSGAGIVVAFGVAFASSSGKSSMGRPLAIFGPQGERREIRVGDVAGELGAPRAWTFGGCVGLVLAILAVAAAIVARHAGRMLDGGVDATHLGGGWVAIGDAKRHVASLEGAAPGPVVTLATAARGTTYRDDGSPHALSAKPGTRDALRDQIATRVLAWSCVAIATVAMTSAPLWIARLSGLL